MKTHNASWEPWTLSFIIRNKPTLSKLWRVWAWGGMYERQALNGPFSAPFIFFRYNKNPESLSFQGFVFCVFRIHLRLCRFFVRLRRLQEHCKVFQTNSPDNSTSDWGIISNSVTWNSSIPDSRKATIALWKISWSCRQWLFLPLLLPSSTSTSASSKSSKMASASSPAKTISPLLSKR